MSEPSPSSEHAAAPAYGIEPGVAPAVEPADAAKKGPAHLTKAAHRKRETRRSVIEWTLVIGGALAVALLIRAFLVAAFWIPTGSMEQTLLKGDRVLVNKLSYRLHEVNRGDVIVFERPEGETDESVKDLIKRVVALPGETVAASEDGRVLINGQPLDEPYLNLSPNCTPAGGLQTQTIEPNHVFVMGDNRCNSTDSRVFGPIDEDLIVGRAFVRIWPLSHLGWL